MIKNKKFIVAGAMACMLVATVGTSVLAKSNPIESIPKETLLKEEARSKYVKENDVVNKPNIKSPVNGESKSIEELTEISKSAIKDKLGVDLNAENSKFYTSEEDIKGELEANGSTKLSWYISGVGKPEGVYVVVITAQGEILECAKAA